MCFETAVLTIATPCLRVAAVNRRTRVACLLAAFLFLSPSIEARPAEPQASEIQLYPIATAPSASFTPRVSAAVDPRAAAIASRLRARLRTVRGAPAPSRVIGRRDPGARHREIRERLGDDVRIWRRGRGKTLRQIKGKRLQQAIRGVGTEAERARLTARMFLRRNRALLGFADTDRDLHFRRGDRDSLNRRHLRFNVNHLGLSVWPAELIVHLDPDGNVDLLSGGYQQIPSSLAVDPIVSSDVALASAIANVAGGDEVETSGHQLIIYAPLARRPRLAWKIELSVSIDTLWLVFVDALNGIVLNAYNQVTDTGVAGSGVDLFGDDRDLNLWQQNTTYYMVDTSKAMFDPTSDPASPNIENIRGAIVIKDAQNQPSTSDPTSLPELMQVTSNTGSATSGWLADAVSATFGLSETYDYFLERHGRDSLDGAGGTITAVVRYAQNYQNALWNPGVQLMLFGDGLPFARALDVVGHELTHGVTTNSADLVYQGQSGALNEAFSDIFGEMVEARTKGTPDWLKGGPDLGLTIQNYANPTSINCLSGIACPANMSDFINTTQDNGGVHLNSSIINHAFYVLAEGLTGAIGLSDAERIFYRTLTTKLVRSSQFIDARLGAIASAEELFGPDSTQVQKTAEAFDTVKIFDAPSTPPAADNTWSHWPRFDRLRVL